MDDLTIPLAVATPVGLAVAGAIGALWGKIASVEKRERADCAERIASVEKRVEKLESQRDDCEERWRREVRRGAELFARASVEAPKEEPPMPPKPDWHETTGVRDVRAEIEREAILRSYVESTPPRAKMPSRPR